MGSKSLSQIFTQNLKSFSLFKANKNVITTYTNHKSTIQNIPLQKQDIMSDKISDLAIQLIYSMIKVIKSETTAKIFSF